MTTQALLHVLSRCTDSARTAEFNTWYNDVHIPDVLELDEFKSVRRYQLGLSNIDDMPQYLAVFEVETDDVEATREVMLAHIRGKAATGSVTRHDLFDGASLSWYVQIFNSATVD